MKAPNEPAYVQIARIGFAMAQLRIDIADDLPNWRILKYIKEGMGWAAVKRQIEAQAIIFEWEMQEMFDEPT